MQKNNGKNFLHLSGLTDIWVLMKGIAATFKSLEDETRLRIMALLLDTEELCVCHFMDVLQLPQSTVSRHLANLKNAGWLKDRRTGVWIHYSINPDLGSDKKTLIHTLRTILKQNDIARRDKERLANLEFKDCYR